MKKNPYRTPGLGKNKAIRKERKKIIPLILMKNLCQTSPPKTKSN